MYELDAGVILKPTVIHKLCDKLKIIPNVIQFYVVCYARRCIYGGNDCKEEESESRIITSVQKRPRRIQICYKDNITGEFKILTPIQYIRG